MTGPTVGSTRRPEDPHSRCEIPFVLCEWVFPVWVPFPVALRGAGVRHGRDGGSTSRLRGLLLRTCRLRRVVPCRETGGTVPGVEVPCQVPTVRGEQVSGGLRLDLDGTMDGGGRSEMEDPCGV